MNSRNQLNVAQLRISCSTCSLGELCLPRGLPQDDVEKLAEIVEQPQPINKGEAVYSTGDTFKSLFVVKVGAVKVVSLNAEGIEQIVSFALPGELVGMDGVHTGSYYCTAIALDTTRFCALPFDQLETLARDVPGLQHEMFRIASKEISQEHDMLLMLNNRTADERLATFLFTLGQRFHRRGFSATEFNMAMSRAEIANYLGLAVETVSRLFSRFKETGLIDVQGRYVHLLKVDEIRAMVHDCTGSQAKRSTAAS